MQEFPEPKVAPVGHLQKTLAAAPDPERTPEHICLWSSQAISSTKRTGTRPTTACRSASSRCTGTSHSSTPRRWLTWSSTHFGGHRRGPLWYQLVPTAAKGPRHPQGRSEPASGALRAAELTGNLAVGASHNQSGPPGLGLRRVKQLPIVEPADTTRFAVRKQHALAESLRMKPSRHRRRDDRRVPWPDTREVRHIL